MKKTKIEELLTTDIKLINSYLLILIVLVTISVTSMGTYAIFTYDKQSSNLIKMVYQPSPPPNLDESGANVPVLATGMIPVYYDSAENVWKKADETNSNEAYKWYDYDEKMWANAVTVTSTNRATYLNDTLSPAGTTIPMSDINTMWVWIPRYSAETWEGIEGESTEAYCYDPTTGTRYDNYVMGRCTMLGYTWVDAVSSPPGAFTINFVDKNEDAHEAFTFGSQELSGMWIGKFENSSNITCELSNNVAVGSGCNLATIRPKIIPNVESWRGAMVSTFFLDILNMKENGNQYGFDTSIDTTLDTHMMKNSEWGAVSYLSQSIYGRCSNATTCPEIGINNNSSFITGYGAPAGSSSSCSENDEDAPGGPSGPVDDSISPGGDVCTATNGTYETELGQLASTTGNIYGIYDMSGGADDYVMGVYWDGTNKWSGSSYLNSITNLNHSGFNGCLGSGCLSTYEEGVPYPDEKYYDLYTNTGSESSPITDYTGDRQHALTEVDGWYSSDYSYFVNAQTPWFTRGSTFDKGSNADLFSFYRRNGTAFTYSGSFSVIVK